MQNRILVSGANAHRAFAFGFLLSLIAVPAANAQQGFGRVEDTQTNINAYYYFVTPGSATVQISAFGKLHHPGVYVLEEGANLALLLGLSGGPTEPNQPDIKQTATVKLYRNTGGARSLAYEASFEEVMDQASASPVLTEGDIVIVDVVQKRRMNWRDIFTVVGPLLSTLLLIERLTSN